MWFKDLQKIFRKFKTRTIINIKMSVGPDGVEVLSAQAENSNFLSYIGNSADCPLTKEYEEKYLKAFGRLTKGKTHA